MILEFRRMKYSQQTFSPREVQNEISFLVAIFLLGPYDYQFFSFGAWSVKCVYSLLGVKELDFLTWNNQIFYIRNLKVF